MPPNLNHIFPNGLSDTLHLQAMPYKLDDNFIIDLSNDLAKNNHEIKKLLIKNQMIGDKGIQAISKWSNLEELSLSGSLITDRGAKVISTMPAIKVLDLTNCNITDEAITYLLEIKTLQKLSLCGTKITDSSLQKILNTKNQLHTLVLLQTATSETMRQKVFHKIQQNSPTS